GHGSFGLEVLYSEPSMGQTLHLVVSHHGTRFVHGTTWTYHFVAVVDGPVFRQHTERTAITRHHFINGIEIQSFEFLQSFANGFTHAVSDACAAEAGPSGRPSIFHVSFAASDEDGASGCGHVHLVSRSCRLRLNRHRGRYCPATFNERSRKRFPSLLRFMSKHNS